MDIEEQIVEYVLRNFRSVEYSHKIHREWYVFVDTIKRRDILFYWNGEALWGPYTSDATRELSFQPKGE